MEPVVQASVFTVGPGLVRVVGGFLGLLPRWGFAVACVSCLIALLAVAVRYGQGTSLCGYLEAPGGDAEPAWWLAFENGFRRYASTPVESRIPCAARSRARRRELSTRAARPRPSGFRT